MYVTQGKQGISSQLECGHPVNDYLLYRHRVQQIHLLKPQRRIQDFPRDAILLFSQFFLKTTWK